MRSGRGGWGREVPTLLTDHWQDFTFDLSDLPGKESVNSVGVYISEDTYPNGTVLDFYLARLELVRYRQPTLHGLTLVAPIAFADTRAVAAKVELLGVKEGANAPVELSLLRGKTVVAKQVVRGPGGRDPGLARPTPRSPRRGVHANRRGAGAASPFRSVSSPRPGRRPPDDPTRVLVLLVLLVAATAASAEVLVFDMGSRDSALWPGAERVTAQDARWTSTEGLTEFDRPATGSPLWTNAVTQDGVVGKGSNAFRFPAAAGPWNVYVLSGIGGKWDRSTYPYWDFDVATGGGTWSVQIEAPRWDGPFRFQHHTFRTTSTGQVEVKLAPRNGWMISGIVAWQAKDEAAARQLISPWRSGRPRRSRRSGTRTCARPPALPRRCAVVDQKRAASSSGTATGPRRSTPGPTRRRRRSTPRCALFASPGEYEPLTFTVRPLRALAPGAACTVSGLGPVPATAIEVRKVRYVKVRRNYSDTGLYRIVPDVLERWTGGPLPANENATFWLTVHVPEERDSPASTAEAVGSRPTARPPTCPWSCACWGSNLQEDPKHTYGIYYDSVLSPSNEAPDALSKQHWIRVTEQQLRRHGRPRHAQRHPRLLVQRGRRARASSRA